MRKVVAGILFLAVFMLLKLPAHAQQQPDEDGPAATGNELVRRVGSVDGVQQLLNAPASANGARNQAMVLQQGNRNSLDVSQQTAAAMGPNLVQLQQIGDFNVLDVQQRGAGLEQQVLQQGNRNSVISRMQGTNVESTIRQNGDANKVQQDLTVNQRNYTIQQDGNRNELIQRENGQSTPAGYQVHMTGNMRVVIEHGP